MAWKYWPKLKGYCCGLFKSSGHSPSASAFYQSCCPHFYIFENSSPNPEFFSHIWIPSYFRTLVHPVHPVEPRAPRAHYYKFCKKTIIFACTPYWYKFLSNKGQPEHSSFKFFTHKNISNPYERFHIQHVWIFFGESFIHSMKKSSTWRTEWKLRKFTPLTKNYFETISWKNSSHCYMLLKYNARRDTVWHSVEKRENHCHAIFFRQINL